MPRLFPDSRAENRVIAIKQRWHGEGQLALMVDRVVDLQSDGGTQCVFLYIYDDRDEGTGSPFVEPNATHQRRDAVTDLGLKHFQDAYPGETITKEDLFVDFH